MTDSLGDMPDQDISKTNSEYRKVEVPKPKNSTEEWKQSMESIDLQRTGALDNPSMPEQDLTKTMNHD